MTYRGQVKNGVVVLEGSPALVEGTVVRVEPEENVSLRFKRGSADTIMRHAGFWRGEEAEVDRLLQEVRQLKEAEVIDVPPLTLGETLMELAGIAPGLPSDMAKNHGRSIQGNPK